MNQTSPPSDVNEYDLIVIGAGPVGENVADRAVRGGLTAVIVERELVGGECSYWACMPSKTLLRPGAVVRAARAVPGAQQAVVGEIDAAAVFAARDVMTSHWDDAGQVQWLEGAGITLHRGHGRLTGRKQVEVTDAAGVMTRLTARHAVVVSTGTAAIVPDIPGLADVNPWTSREATSAPTAPARLAVIGGGVVAAEMATAFADLGSEVTMIIRSGLLGGLEAMAGQYVADALTGRGVRILRDADTSGATRTDGTVVLTLNTGETVEADEVLVATGRRPATDDIGLPAVGLQDGSWLDVDETLRVLDGDGVPIGGAGDATSGWLYAVGDVNHRALLTHQGKYQARAAGDVIAARALGHPVEDAPWGTHVATADHAAVPQVIFTDPEVAAVGLTMAQAEQAGIAVRAVDVEFSSVAGAAVQAEHYTGAARLVIDTDREVMLGATFVGPGVAELVHAATIAVVGEVPIARLWHAVPSYPTLSEVWLRLLEAWGRPDPGSRS